MSKIYKDDGLHLFDNKSLMMINSQNKVKETI
jgi:hypothetical protein